MPSIATIIRKIALGLLILVLVNVDSAYAIKTLPSRSTEALASSVNTGANQKTFLFPDMTIIQNVPYSGALGKVTRSSSALYRVQNSLGVHNAYTNFSASLSSILWYTATKRPDGRGGLYFKLQYLNNAGAVLQEIDLPKADIFCSDTARIYTYSIEINPNIFDLIEAARLIVVENQLWSGCKNG